MLFCLSGIAQAGAQELEQESLEPAKPESETTKQERETKSIRTPDRVWGGEHRQSRYIAYRYANDVLFNTDRDFTQGMQLRYFDPYLRYSPVFWLALELPDANELAYGLQLRWDGYTPDDLDAVQVIESDRPYSAYFHLSHLLRSIDTRSKSQLQTEIKFGIIGPETLGAETQRGVHRLFGGTDPQGWSNQIKTDIVVDYRLTYQRQLWRPLDFIEFNVAADGSLGTLDTYLGAGPLLRLGFFQSYTPKYRRGDNWVKQIYFQTYLEGRATGYNARFQGGLFNNNSRHTLQYGDLKLFTAKLDSRLVFELGNLEFRFGAAWQSRQFDAGHEHKYAYWELFVAF